MKLRFRVCILSLLFLLPLLMLAGAKGDAAKGKTLYSRCSICHGPSGEGNEAIAKAYGVKMPALGAKDVQALDDAALKKVVAEGKGKMPPVKLSDTETDDVVAFVRSLKKPSPK
jgi:mono/diheme cytochrome c family protein